VDESSKEAVDRVARRYARAPLADRIYARQKLLHDPVVDALCQVSDHLGVVTDAGCGRGQTGLWLLETGRATKLTGFDWDERKVGVAAIAGGEDATFSVGDLLTANYPASDCVLLLDVLHYLTREAQQRVMANAAAALTPGGAVLVREVDAAGQRQSWFTRIAEHLGTAIGYNRAASLEFLPAETYLGWMRELGLVTHVIHPDGPQVFHNVLIVGRRPLRAFDA